MEILLKSNQKILISPKTHHSSPKTLKTTSLSITPSSDFITYPQINDYNLMLLHANKKTIQHSQQPTKSNKSTRPTPLSIPRIRLKAIDSPTFRPEPTKTPINDSLELICSGMKLNSRLRSPEKERKRLSGAVQRTITQLKPLGYTAPVPTFSSLQLENQHLTTIFRRFSENPEEPKLQKKASDIPSNLLLLNHDIRNDNISRQRTAFYTTNQSYVGLHPRNETTFSPNISGVLEAIGTCEVQSHKYSVSDLHLGYSFKNLIGQFGKLEQCTARNFLRQLVETMVKVHAKGYTHNRLSLDTIVHDAQGHLLVNFFKAKAQPVQKNERLTYFYYFSPEMLQSQEAHKSNKNDVWAIGNIALQFLSKKSLKMSRYHPYNKASMTESRFKQSMLTQNLMQKIAQNQQQTNKGEEFSNEAVNFISTCLQIAQEKRPCMQELLQYPFLQ